MEAAELVAVIRRASGLSQRALGERGGTSGSTIAAYEAGDKEPRLTTLTRLAEAAGYRLRIEVEPIPAALPRADRRSLALHRKVLDHLLRDPEPVRSRGRRNLVVMRQANPEARPWLDEWERLLEGPMHELGGALISTDEHARALRQSSPFAGVLSQEERLEALRGAT
jgi:transcriptional regulator with XRE-family HTH domain